MGNMYSDSVKQWNVFVGCKFDCIYCKKSFQAQMKRQKNRCMKCYNYEPHFHEERLKQSLPNSKGDEFIWACSSGDISFAKPEWIKKILKRIGELPYKTFFIQTKQPFDLWEILCRLKDYHYRLPPNLIIGITLETNRDKEYNEKISQAPYPSLRVVMFEEINHHRKFITIEPILDFDLGKFIEMIHRIEPERVYIGYDTKKNKLPEPTLYKTLNLIEVLKTFTTVKTKLLRERWDS